MDLKLRNFVPFPLRVEMRRLQRLPTWIAEGPALACRPATTTEREDFGFVLAEHASPLKREVANYAPHLQSGKERNVALALRRIDGRIVAPNQVFSYHHTVGRPSRLRGFRMGLELHAGQPAQGIGGGCCQIANLLYILALRGGMRIVERHRHALDLFPDQERTVPFGCGATVFYNYADFRFENPLPEPVLLRLWITDGMVRGTLATTRDPGWTVEVYEVDHRFFREEDLWYRENRIRRRFVRPDATVLLDYEEAHNRGRVLYDPSESVCGAQS